MARARNIKPGFFTNEDLVEIDPLGRLLFIGLWTLADREGRLDDRPKKIKMEVFPCDNCDVDELLEQLAEKGFILRYQVGSGKYIQIVNFSKHQNPHKNEKPSEIPAPNCEKEESAPEESSTTPVMERTTPEKAESAPEKAVVAPADSLIPDSPFSDSLIPSSDHQQPEDAGQPETIKLQDYVCRELGIGLIGPTETKIIFEWVKRFEAVTLDRNLVAEAIGRTEQQSGEAKIRKKISYANGILADWESRGIRSPDDIPDARKERDAPGELPILNFDRYRT